MGSAPLIGSHRADVILVIRAVPRAPHDGVIQDRCVDSDTALGRMQVAAALWSVGQVSAAEMVDLACELLVTGFDGFNVAMLAGVHARHADEDVPELLEAALADVGLSYYARDSHTGQEAAVRVVAARVLAGLVPPRDLARWAHLTIGHGGVALAERLVELDDVYDVVHYVDTTEHDVDDLIRIEARRIIETSSSNGLPVPPPSS